MTHWCEKYNNIDYYIFISFVLCGIKKIVNGLKHEWLNKLIIT